jgi:hypothetical protein
MFMERRPLTLARLAVLFVIFAAGPLCAQDQAKPIFVAVSVERQGSGGIFKGQAAHDPPPAELSQLRSLIEAEVGKLPNHRLASVLDEKNIFVVDVLVGKFRCGGTTYILTSSAMTFRTGVPINRAFVTHDMLMLPSLGAAAHAIVGQLVNAEMRRRLLDLSDVRVGATSEVVSP